MEYFIGAVVALFVKYTKQYLGTTKWGTVLFVLCVSLVSSVVYLLVTRIPNATETFLKIFATAGAIHNYLIRQIEDDKNSTVFTR